LKEALLFHEIGESLVDDEGCRGVAAGEFPNNGVGKEMTGRIVRSPQENDLISPEDGVDLRDVRDKRPLFP